LEQVTTPNVQNLNSNFKNKKFQLCRLPDGLTGGKGEGDERRLAPATFATSFSLPPRQSAKNVFVDCLEWPTAQEIRTVGKVSFADRL
jgi:hypothetical protein